MSFIWAFSKRDQFVLVAVTALLFPMLYLTLELPKRIVNDAISAETEIVQFYGYTIAQKDLLIALCLAFLVSVLAHGILKMRVNTMKGVLAERLLRRFRYALIEHILRFPRAYQAKTSEGELVSMVTAETEPMGGIMGDAIAQPLLQAGQMLTILLFLFLQSFWFGVAACTMVPLQAWLIPKLQQRVNLLNRSRITQVRALASDIGEIATGAGTLRQNNGWRMRMARTSEKLGRLFETRFEIYKRKFFMKFLNNLLNQIPPFTFFLVGGLLVIDGRLTVGALVAAIAAYKDLSSPWKELLSYYTRVIEMSQRYELVVDRFTPTGLLPDYLGKATSKTQLRATSDKALSFENVTLLDDGGHHVLNQASLEIPRSSWVCVAVEDDGDRAAFVQMLLSEITPSSGTIRMNGEDIAEQTQQNLSDNIGFVTSTPYIFQGTVGENILMPLQVLPSGRLSPRAYSEAKRTGNSPDAPEGGWRPLRAEAEFLHKARADWMPFIEALGAQEVLLSRALEQKLNPDRYGELITKLTQLRAFVLGELGETEDLPRFYAESYSDGLTLPENLLYSIKKNEGWFALEAAEKIETLLRGFKLYDLVLEQSVVLASTLIEAFDVSATESPLFRQIGVPGDILRQLHDLAKRHDGRIAQGTAWTAEEQRLLISLALNVPSARFDRAFRDSVKEAVVTARRDVQDVTRQAFAHEFDMLNARTWIPSLNILDNLLYGKANELPRAELDHVASVVTSVLAQHLDRLAIADLINDLPTDLRGANLTRQMAEGINLGQTMVKQPDLIIMDRALSSYEEDARATAFSALRVEMPQATIVQVERTYPEGIAFDQKFALRQGQVLPEGATTVGSASLAETSELRRKLQAIQKAPLFSELSGQQLRMLAFSARWLDVPAGAYVFRQNDAPNGAYLIYEGDVSLIARNPNGSENFRVTPPVGTLVGELGLIRNDPRRMDMHADTDVTLLSVDTNDFLSVLETDAQTAYKLIRVLIGYLDKPS